MSKSKSLKRAGIEPGRRPNPHVRAAANGYEGRGAYSWIDIEKFRGFEHLELPDLGRINLIFGPNNSGKTTILEAVFTHASGLNFLPFYSQVVLRRQEQAVSGPLDLGDKIKSLFLRSKTIPYQYTIKAQVEDDHRKHVLSAIFRPSAQLSDLDPLTFGQFSSTALAARSSSAPVQTNSWEVGSRGLRVKTTDLPSVFIGEWVALFSGAQREWDIMYPVPSISTEQPFKLAVFHDILAHRQPEADLRVYANLKRYALIADFVKVMGQTFPEVKDIDIIPYPDGTQGPVYVTTKDDHLLPLYAFGDGMRRWFYLLGQMIVHPIGFLATWTKNSQPSNGKTSRPSKQRTNAWSISNLRTGARSFSQVDLFPGGHSGLGFAVLLFSAVSELLKFRAEVEHQLQDHLQKIKSFPRILPINLLLRGMRPVISYYSQLARPIVNLLTQGTGPSTSLVVHRRAFSP